jgi:putative membrane protein
MNDVEIKPDRFEVHAGVGDHFAWLRTRFAIERTLMAWLRTSAALIGFGFTIVEVLQRVQSQAPQKPVLLPEAPRDLGLALIGSGVLGIAIALWQYRMVNDYLWSTEFRAIAGLGGKAHRTPLVTISLLIGFVGVAAFTTILFRLG